MTISLGEVVTDVTVLVCCCASHAGFTDDWVLVVMTNQMYFSFGAGFKLLSDLSEACKGDCVQTLNKQVYSHK